MQSLPAGLADRAAGDRRFRGHGCGGGDGGRLGHAKSVWIWRRIVSRIAAARSARSPGSVTVLLWVPDVWTIRWDRLNNRSTGPWPRSEEHTSELQSLMRISYAVLCLKK